MVAINPDTKAKSKEMFSKIGDFMLRDCKALKRLNIDFYVTSYKF